MNDGPWPSFSHAFQPIVDLATGETRSWEALVRSRDGGPASAVLGAISEEHLYRFDEVCRASSVELAARLAVPGCLNLNFLPRGLEARPTTLDQTLAVAKEAGLEPERLVLEVSETELVADPMRFAERMNEVRGRGVQVAIDDFGAGYSGLNLLASFQPDQVKLDMLLARGIEAHGPRQAIVRGVMQVCTDLGIEVIVEGVETADEFGWFRDAGVELFQGYFLARPSFEAIVPAPPLPAYPK